MPFEFTPVKLVYGGEALGFHDSHTVLAARLLAGERAEVEEYRRQKGVIHARPVRIIDPSPQRVEPPCPYFGRCGGCQYQHLPAEAQAAAKVAILRETLHRLGQIQWSGPIPAHAGPAWNYRNQAQFKVGHNADGTATLGFFEAESNRLVSIDACPILSPRLNLVLQALRSRSWARQLETCREVEIFADDRDEAVMLTLAGSWIRGEEQVLATRCLTELAGVCTVGVLQNADLQVFGAPHLIYRVGEFRYAVSPTSFFQTSRYLLPEFVATVLGPAATPAAAPGLDLEPRNATVRPKFGALAIDLYAGVGLFTLPLATRFEQVIAVEAHPPAAADLAGNTQSTPAGSVRAVEAATFDFLRRFAQRAPDVVVLDPPRAGVGIAALKLLVTLRPMQLRYASCSPPTLARDLGFLLKHGYHLDSLELFDFFPQTYHIEALARLTRIG